LSIGLTWLQPLLEAQVPYESGAGSTTISGFYNPLDMNPAPKAPVPFSQPIGKALMPVLPWDQYLAKKAELAPLVQPNFVFPPRAEVSPVSPPPFAPSPSPPPVIAATPSVSFAGIPNTGLQPPSPDIAIGPADVLLAVNSAIAQYSRTGTLKKQTPLQEWFASVFPAVCPSGPAQCLIFDPHLRYDQLHGRFLFLAAARDFQARLSYLLLSVSNGATFDGGWKIWALDARLDGTVSTANWADFWRLGFDDVAVYLAGNMYSQGDRFQYAKIRVLKKSDLYNPATTTLAFRDIWNMRNEDNTAASSLTPVHVRGRPTATTVPFFVNASDVVPSTRLTVWKINDPLSATLAVTRSTVTGAIPYYYPAPAPQLGGPATLETGDSRVLKAVFRSGYIYTARNSGYTDQPTTVTFDVIDTSTMTLRSQTRLRNAHSFYPAFDVPATIAPGAPLEAENIITGTTTTAEGALGFAGVSKLKNGETYFDLGGGVNAWGHYFGGALDPISGGLWAYGEYAKTRAPDSTLPQWGTWAGHFPWTTTQKFTDVPNTSVFADYINVLSMWQLTTGCSTTPARFCPTDRVTRAQLAVFIIRAMFGNTFTYTTTPYFTDVPATNVFFPFVQKMRDLGITSGCRPSAFCPDDPVSRAAAAVFIVRGKLAALSGDNFPYPATPIFTDVPTTAAEFPFIQKFHDLGITTGCGPALFCPGSLLTRQEAAVLLTRAFLN
jgi:hypothetical protein